MTAHPAFFRIDPPGDRVPVVLDSPHSGTDYPEDFRPAVPMAKLRQAEDAFVDELYACGPRLGALLLGARFPRSYIDPNRSVLDMDTALLDAPWPGPAAAGRKTALGIGLIWRVLDSGEPIYDRKLTVEEVRRRITAYHQPYQKAVKDALDETHGHFGAVWHLNCHSMPALSSVISEEGPGKSRPDFVLGDRDGTTCAPEFVHLVADTLQGFGYSVAVNEPYKGVELIGRIGRPELNRHSLQIEIRRPVYMDEDTRASHAGFAPLQQHLDLLLGVVAQYVRGRLAGSEQNWP